MPGIGQFVRWRRLPGPPRRIHSADETDCQVYEIASGSPVGENTHLVLSTSSRVRRLKGYPSDWRDLDDARLLALFDEG